MEFTGPNNLAVAVEETSILSAGISPAYIPKHPLNVNSLTLIQVGQQIITNNK